MAGAHPQPEMHLDDELFLAELTPGSVISETVPESDIEHADWQKSICLENNYEETAAFPSTFLEGVATPLCSGEEAEGVTTLLRLDEEAESGDVPARMDSLETASPRVFSYPGSEELPETLPCGHLPSLAQAQAQAQPQAQGQAQTPSQPQKDAETLTPTRQSSEGEQASLPLPARAMRFPARFGITDEILEEAERGSNTAPRPQTDPSLPSSFLKDAHSEAGSACRPSPGHASLHSEAQLASDAGPFVPQVRGDVSDLAVTSRSRDGAPEALWGADSSEPSSGSQDLRPQPGIDDVSRALRTTAGAVQPLELREVGTEQSSGAHDAEQGNVSTRQAGDSRGANLDAPTEPPGHRILHLDTSLGSVRPPTGNAAEDRMSLAPRLASVLRDIKRRHGGTPAAPLGRPQLPTQLGAPGSASASKLEGAGLPWPDRGSSNGPAEHAMTDVVGAFSIMGLQDFSSASPFLVTQCSITSLKRRARQSAVAPAAPRGHKAQGGTQVAKQAAKAGASQELALALPPGASGDESSAEAMLRRFFSTTPNSRQRALAPKSGQAGARRRVLLPRQPLHSLSGPHFRHPFMVSGPPGSPWPVALYSPSPRAPPQLDPALNGRTTHGVVSHMARSNLLALADAYLANHTAVIQPLTELLRNMASPHGNSTERIVHYTLAALEARFKGKPLGPLFASMTLSSQADLEASQYETGWKVFEEIVNTYTLVDVLKGPSRVHIILINDMGGICWSTLFQGLADQAGGAPPVRVTVLKLFLLGSKEDERDNERSLRVRVSEAAARSGVPLTYRIICAQPSELHPGMVPVHPDEVVAVVSCWALAIFPDSKILPSNPRNSMLKWIHSLSPRVFMMSEIDSDFNGGPFAARFHEFLMKVAAGFEFMGNTMPLGSPSRKALELSFVGSLVDAIAFEGLGRVNRTERFEMWVDRLLSVGFTQHPLPEKAWEALRDLSTINESFHVSNERGVARFHLCGIPNFFCSAWSPC